MHRGDSQQRLQTLSQNATPSLAFQIIYANKKINQDIVQLQKVMFVIQYFIFVCQKLEVLRVHLLPSNWLVVIASRTMTAKRNPQKFPVSVNNRQLMYQVVLYADYLLYNYFVYNNQGINTCCHLVKNGKNKGQVSSFIHVLMDTANYNSKQLYL